MNDEPASLSNILANLTDFEEEIREAVKQFCSKPLIPLPCPASPSAGRARVRRQPPEQIHMNQLIKAERDAHRQAQMQRYVPDQDSQSTPDQSAQPPPDQNSSGTPDD
jgi:hypothetical protein